MAPVQVTPEVSWAQRSDATKPEKNVIYLTVNAPDLKDPEIDIRPDALYFDANDSSNSKHYHLDLHFYEEIDPNNSSQSRNDRCVYFVLRKKTPQAAFWPRLLKDKAKVHFLRTDFDKWVDEDEQDEEPEDDLSQLGGMPEGMAGMAGMPGGMPGMEGMAGMGGMGGMPGMPGGLDFSALSEQMKSGGFPGAPSGDAAEEEDETVEEVTGSSEAAPAASESKE